jgi:signal transduction histidine kinase
MNLILRITLVFAAASLIVFLIGGTISYEVMKREVDLEQQRFLAERLDRTEQYINRRIPTDSVTFNQLLIVPLAEVQDEYRLYSDTIVMHAQLQRLEPHLKLTAIKNVNGKSYYVSIYGVIIESDDIMDAVTESLLKIYLILLAVIVPVGLIASNLLLRPFKRTLLAIQNFSLKDSDQLHFPKSSVPEFRKLNDFLNEMSDKARHDYKVLKEFSENASHELQTPIAIMQSKIEVLLDNSDLNEEQTGQISQLQNSLKRLSKLSNSLSLLTKIENLEFDNLLPVSLTHITDNLLSEFSELIELKSIRLEKSIEPNIQILADQVLIELMITNLINNAIRHNTEDGFIKVTLTLSYLKIENSGKQLAIDPAELFERFKKSNQSESSLGLGLAIVKRICELYNFEVSYSQVNQNHALRIDF